MHLNKSIDYVYIWTIEPTPHDSLKAYVVKKFQGVAFMEIFVIIKKYFFGTTEMLSLYELQIKNLEITTFMSAANLNKELSWWVDTIAVSRYYPLLNKLGVL